MKKTFPVNINGIVFYIDEDAYNLLNTYLDQLRKAFPGKEGGETVDDIESRIAEVFSEKSSGGSGRVIVLDDVNAIIEQMGRVDDIAPDAASGTENDNTDPADSPRTEGTPPPFVQPPAEQGSKKLYRDERNKVFGGVVAGLALYMGWNMTVMRVLLVILALCTKGLPLLIAYLIAWMVIPAAVTPRQILEMTGTPVTVGNVGQTILGTPDTGELYTRGHDSGFFQILGKIFLAFLGIIGGCIGLAMLVVLVVAISGLILYSGWGDITILDSFDEIIVTTAPAAGGWALICLSLSVFIPCCAAIWAGCNALFNLRTPSRTGVISFIIIEVICIIAAVVLMRLASIEAVGCMASTASICSAMQM